MHPNQPAPMLHLFDLKKLAAAGLCRKNETINKHA
jgi:hypothetical protein